MTLSPEVHQAVTAFAGRRRVLLGVDFDGTLAPFVRDPMDAAAAPGGLEAVRAAGALDGVSVVILSGRDIATLRTLTGVGEDEPIVLVGSHGAQSSLAGDLDGALLDEIAGEPAPRAEYVFRPELVVRGSTGACPKG